MFQIYKFLSRMECGKIRTLAAFLTEYFVLLKFDGHTRFRLKIPVTLFREEWMAIFGPSF